MNGNDYQLWYVDANFQVFNVDPNGKIQSMSGMNFAFQISVGTDGTVWIVSNEPDPDGGGGKIYWSDGSAQWNEITGSAPGAKKIVGTSQATALYITFDGQLISIDTKGNFTTFYTGDPVLDVAVEGNNLWLILSDKPGEKPSLHYGKFTKNPSLTEFAENPQPLGITCDISGSCYGIIDGNVFSYSTDLKTVYPFAPDGPDGISSAVSGKNWIYMISSEAAEGGAKIYEFFDNGPGEWRDTGWAGIAISATYRSH